jgi:hypothetical protein
VVRHFYVAQLARLASEYISDAKLTERGISILKVMELL